MLYIWHGNNIEQELRSGDNVNETSKHLSRHGDPGVFVRANGDELQQALIIATNGRTERLLGRKVVTFVGDEARKIILNWQ